MSDNRSRHDRLAVRLSLIISRLMAGESLSLKTLSDEFGVTERTLQRDFHQRLVHLDLEYRNGRYSLRRQSSPVRSLKCFLLYRIPGSHGYFRSERTTDNLSYRQPGALSLPYLATGAGYHCNVPRVFLATHPGNKTVYPHLSDD